VVANLDVRSLHDRSWAVFPVVALVAGVVNGQLAPAEEIGKYPDSWNGIPVPINHPTDQRGGYISANEPAVEDKAVIGRFYHARWDGSRLSGEVWLDLQKITQLGGEAMAILKALEAGEPMEVSTAYYADLEPVSGHVAGVAYSGIQRNLRPDHLALLPHATGACSWEDGCGIPRANCKCSQEANMGKIDQEAVAQPTAQELSQEALEPTTEPTANQEDGEPTAEAGAALEPTTEAGEPMEPMASQEEPEEPTAEPVANLLDSNELSDLVGLVMDFGGIGALREALWGLRELQELVAHFGGATAVSEALAATKVQANLARAEIVSKLATNQRCAFSRQELEGMGMDQLVKLEISLRPADYSGRVVANHAEPESVWVKYEGPKL